MTFQAARVPPGALAASVPWGGSDAQLPPGVLAACPVLPPEQLRAGWASLRAQQAAASVSWVVLVQAWPSASAPLV